MSKELKVEMRNFIKELEDILQIRFKKGYNKEAKCMKNLFDPVICDHRLLIIYIGIEFLDYITYLYLCWMKFQYKQSGSMNYYHKQGNIKRSPIIYFHGVGLGIIFNTKLIMGIMENREAFIVELPWVSQKLFTIIPKPQQFVRYLEHMLTKHGLNKQGVCVIGHSYGTCVAAWMLVYTPKLVSSVVLIEPVCLLLFSHKLCYNFLYKKVSKPIHLIARYFVAREISTALTMTRYFIWQDNICLYDELPPYTVIVLSQNDFIVDSDRVRHWLQTFPSSDEFKGKKKDGNKKIITIYTDRTIDHGHILVDGKLIEVIKTAINKADDFLDQRENQLKITKKESISYPWEYNSHNSQVSNVQ